MYKRINMKKISRLLGFNRFYNFKIGVQDLNRKCEKRMPSHHE